MEPVLTAPLEHETLTRVKNLPPKLTRQDKEITHSSNGGSSDKPAITIVPSKKTYAKDDDSESEGWRYVEIPSKNGRVKYERVPLTRYELLHPQEGYIIVHASPHDFNTACIGNSTKIGLRDNPQARIFGDLRTDLNLPGIRPVSPDVSILFGVSQERIWKTFNCQKEGVIPSVVFEVTSPGTRENDFDEKYNYYCQAGIPYYVILDIRYGWDGPVETATYDLYVFERISGQYEKMQANMEGKYWLPPLKMWVGLGEKGILCYDESGELLLAPEELARTLVETESERDAAIERADEQERLANEADDRAAEQKQLAKQEAARAAEQERIVQEERALAQQEAARAAEQERIAHCKLNLRLKQKSQNCSRKLQNFKVMDSERL